MIPGAQANWHASARDYAAAVAHSLLGAASNEEVNGRTTKPRPSQAAILELVKPIFPSDDAVQVQRSVLHACQAAALVQSSSPPIMQCFERTANFDPGVVNCRWRGACGAYES